MHSPDGLDLQRVAVIIPAHNESESLPKLLQALEPLPVGQVVVADNASTDRTAEIARQAGCDVVHEPVPGYGAACAAGIAAVREEIDIIVFLDADLSDDPARLPELVRPLREEGVGLAIGCRDPHLCEPGALTVPQRFGNWLATTLIWLGWGYRFRDLGPFRAITRAALERIDMQDRAFGWTVEMQVRAVQLGIPIAQIPVPYRNRHAGQSKISGTVRGVILAGYWILTTIAHHYLRRAV